VPLRLGGEPAPATEPPVREPAREVELLRCGIERALIATTGPESAGEAVRVVCRPAGSCCPSSGAC